MSPHTSSYDNLFRFYNEGPVFARKHYICHSTPLFCLLMRKALNKLPLHAKMPKNLVGTFN